MAQPARGGTVPHSGDVLQVSREASVQFARPMLFRVIRVHDWPTYTGWVWLDGYELNAAGDAVDRRSIFVQLRGLQKVPDPRTSGRRPLRPPSPATHPHRNAAASRQR